MASIGQLVRVVAETSGLDESSVKLIARYLREAGLIAQQSTGGGAARMTASDAVSLLIAVNGSTPAKDAARSVTQFWNIQLRTTVQKNRSDELKSVEGEVLSDNFGDTFVKLISFFMNGSSGVELTGDIDTATSIRLRIEFERPGPEASIGIWTSPDGGQTYSSGVSIYFKPDDADDDLDRSVITKITHQTIGAVIFALNN